jgi:hypothetical protein
MAKRLILPAPFGRLQLQMYDPSLPGLSQIQVKVLATSLKHFDWKGINKDLFIPSFPHDMLSLNQAFSKCLFISLSCFDQSSAWIQFSMVPALESHKGFKRVTSL